MTAAPDNAYLSGHTARLVSGYFDLRDLGEFHIKGAQGPLHVYELEAAGRLRTRFEAERVRGLSRFVGRDREMAVLEAALAQGMSGPGQVVGVVAPPGVGKSRLCFEFVERCRARGLPVYETRGVAHGKQIPLLPMLELFRAFFGISGRDAERVHGGARAASPPGAPPRRPAHATASAPRGSSSPSRNIERVRPRPGSRRATTPVPPSVRYGRYSRGARPC